MNIDTICPTRRLGDHPMPHKIFAERLNQALDSIEAPENTSERIHALSLLIKVPKFKAAALLNGEIIPDEMLLHKMAEEFDISGDWLLGNNKTKLKN
jgi:hypothetical protein